MKLAYLYVSNSGNPGIICAPQCVSSIISANLNVPSTICPTNQDIGMCSLVAATNIHSISGYSQWSCTTGGYTSTAPCTSPVWSRVLCSGNVVTSINVYNLGLTGLF